MRRLEFFVFLLLDVFQVGLTVASVFVPTWTRRYLGIENYVAKGHLSLCDMCALYRIGRLDPFVNGLLSARVLGYGKFRNRIDT